MKKLLFTILAILVCVFIGDRLIGKTMWWFNQHSKDMISPKLRYLTSETRDDVVFMGTSRCNRHYVTQIFEDSLGLKCYNGGIDGSDNIYAQYCILNLMLNNHSPKVICLDLKTSYYGEQDEPFATMTYYAPYIGNNPESDKILKLAAPTTYIH